MSSQNIPLHGLLRDPPYGPLYATPLGSFGPLYNELLIGAKGGSLSCDALQIGLRAMLNYLRDRCSRDTQGMGYWSAIELVVATLHVCFMGAVSRRDYRTSDRYTLKLLELLGDLRTGEPHERIAAAIDILKRKEYLRDCTVDDRQ